MKVRFKKEAAAAALCNVPLLLLLLGLWLTPLQIAQAQDNQWVVGQNVGLHKGTAIRQGPGLSYPAHTCVPNDDWTVQVIGGPQPGDGKTWYNTSRKAAGDVSGGTGWVDGSQTDLYDPATGLCPSVGVPNPTPTPTIVIDTTLLKQLETWWNNQSAIIKIAVALLALIVLVWIWRRVAGTVLSLVRAVLLAVILWLVADATRQYWQSTWLQLGGAKLPVDLPLLLAAIPILAWILGLFRRRR